MSEFHKVSCYDDGCSGECLNYEGRIAALELELKQAREEIQKWRECHVSALHDLQAERDQLRGAYDLAFKENESVKRELEERKQRSDIWMKSDYQARDYANQLEKDLASSRAQSDKYKEESIEYASALESDITVLRLQNVRYREALEKIGTDLFLLGDDCMAIALEALQPEGAETTPSEK